MRPLALVSRTSRWINQTTQRRLIFWSTAFWLASVSILSIAFLWIGQNQMLIEARQRNIQLASAISRDVNAQIGSISRSTRAFSQHLEALGSDMDSQASAILNLRLSSTRYKAVYYFDERGALLLHLEDPLSSLLAIKNPHEIVARSSVSVRNEIMDARQKASSSVYLSDVYYASFDYAPILYMSTPLLFPSDEHRVVVYEVDLTDIWQRIELAAVGRTGVTYAVSNHGVIIAHPETSYLGRSMPAAVEPVLASYEGFVEYLEPVKKQEVMAAYSPVGGATAWGIVVEQERSEVYATIFRTGFLISSLWLILGVLGTAIIFVLIRNFTKPIKTLTTTVQHIAQTGQLAKTGMRERPDEVGQLSQAFDSMIDKVKDAEGALKQAYDELDTRVQQRTLDLQDAVTRLRQEISQREAAEELVKQSEAKYRELVESASCIILEIDPEGKILFFNKFAEDFFGYKESEVLGRNAIGMLVPDIESSYTNLQQMVRDLVNHPDMYYQSEYENVRRNGEKAWISWTNKGIQNREKKCDRILCFGIDQTEQKRAELLLAQQAEERVAVNERTRLARDLHDAVSQTLFSASIIADVLPRLWEKDAQQGRKRLEEVRQLTRGALAEMRTLLFELRPAALEDAELSYLLRQLGESITGRVRIPVDVQVEGECKLPVEVKVALYRVTQEALNNVSKHAGASIATIRLNCTDGRAALTIADNGRGFDMSKVRAGSLGLGIMQERARGVGANLTVRSQIGQGTVVSVCWDGQEGERDGE